MPEPIMTIIAAALVTWGATALADGARGAVGKLVRFVRERFQHEASSRDIVEGAMAQPTNEAAVERLAKLLDRTAVADLAFERELRTLWEEAAMALNISQGDVANSVLGGSHGAVVQARDIHGGVNLGNLPLRP